MNYSLTTSSKAIAAVCRFNLNQRANGYGIDTVECLNEIVDEFCAIFDQFPEFTTENAIDFWETHSADDGHFRFPVASVGG